MEDLLENHKCPRELSKSAGQSYKIRGMRPNAHIVHWIGAELSRSHELRLDCTFLHIFSERSIFVYRYVTCLLICWITERHRSI